VVPSAPSTGDPDAAPEHHDHVDETSLSGADIRGKAASGVLLISLRTFAIRGLGLVGNLVLARLLSPEEFGVLAFGLTLILFGQFFADAGIAAGLIRRNQPPTLHELHAILGFQLLVSSVLMLAIAVVAVPSGRSGQVATVMAASVVVSAWRAPATLLLERRLDYRALAAVEVLEGVIFVATSLIAVALGAGVWGVAGAHVVRAAAGSALMMRKSPVMVLRPTWAIGVVRELLGYGLAVSARDFVVLVRLQVINLVTAAVAGLPVLGLYSLADRIMLVPWVVFGSILRVTFPAMARLVSAGEDTRSDLVRGLGLLTVSAGSLLALIAGTAPVLIPSFFGERWTPASDALPLIALGLLIAGPVISVGNGYLYASGTLARCWSPRRRTPLRGSWWPSPCCRASASPPWGPACSQGFTIEGSHARQGDPPADGVALLPRHRRPAPGHRRRRWRRPPGRPWPRAVAAGDGRDHAPHHGPAGRRLFLTARPTVQGGHQARREGRAPRPPPAPAGDGELTSPDRPSPLQDERRRRTTGGRHPPGRPVEVGRGERGGVAGDDEAPVRQEGGHLALVIVDVLPERDLPRDEDRALPCGQGCEGRSDPGVADDHVGVPHHGLQLVVGEHPHDPARQLDGARVRHLPQHVDVGRQHLAQAARRRSNGKCNVPRVTTARPIGTGLGPGRT
jgi:O-antigen/teichoic acid export membrane protein